MDTETKKKKLQEEHNIPMTIKLEPEKLHADSANLHHLVKSQT